MKSFSQIIDDLGGSAVLGRAIRQKDGTVRQWRLRDNIPPEYWPSIVSYAKASGKRDITAASLADLAAQRAKAA
jgi:hypothetical protein